MLTAAERSTVRPRRGASTGPRGYCECQDGSHPVLLSARGRLPAGVPEHSYRAPFLARGPRFLHTTPTGAYPICGPCHELGHMAGGRR